MPRVLIVFVSAFFFFNDTATTEIYTLSLHDALPIYPRRHLRARPRRRSEPLEPEARERDRARRGGPQGHTTDRSARRGRSRCVPRGARLGPRGQAVRGREPIAWRRRRPHPLPVDGRGAHG